MVNIGVLYFNNSEGIIIDDGWTHQESSNQQRIWNFSWLSPDDNTTMAKLLVYGNAVNGNQQQTGDNWNRFRGLYPRCPKLRPDTHGNKDRA